ncbi:MAG: L-aspartate oxidase [Hyphomicrobium sp.]
MPNLIQKKFKGFADPKKGVGQGDIVIVGAGLAGLYTALKLAPLPVTIITAAPLGEGASTVWAQGGIAAAVGEGDTFEAHARDTIISGAGIVDERVAQTVAREASTRVRDLLMYGVPFDRDLEGHFLLSREAAHSANRIVRVSGDRAGTAIMRALIAATKATPSIRIMTGYEAEDLVLDKKHVIGVKLARGEKRGSGSYELIPASAVVLATGGIGSLYSISTNPSYARGEAIAFAARAGAIIADPEFVQFHPTAIDTGSYPAPLATEALRGEGAELINNTGERFMLPHHPDAELAPRDLVARCVFAEIQAHRGAYLDCRKAIGERFPISFPTVYAHCQSSGINPITDLIPVVPAAHYHMGGIATDMRGRTSVERLWAAGEVASTGLHGANRLASNSLLEAVVFGGRVAEDIKRIIPLRNGASVARLHLVEGGKDIDLEYRFEALRRIRHIMMEDVGVVRNAEGLKRALIKLKDISLEAGSIDSMVRNMALTARFITTSALVRKESRGAHFRSDYPKPKHQLASRTFINLKTLEMLEKSFTSSKKTKCKAMELSL